MTPHKPYFVNICREYSLLVTNLSILIGYFNSSLQGNLLRNFSLNITALENYFMRETLFILNEGSINHHLTYIVLISYENSITSTTLTCSLEYQVYGWPMQVRKMTLKYFPNYTLAALFQQNMVVIDIGLDQFNEKNILFTTCQKAVNTSL